MKFLFHKKASEIEDENHIKSPKIRLSIPKSKKIIAIGLIVCIVIGIGYWNLSSIHDKRDIETEYKTEQVVLRDITKELVGSGTLEPANSYSVTTLIEGEILSDTFEEGDIVEKDSILYQIDSSDASGNIEKAQISVSQSQRNYSTKVDDLSDLTIKSTARGTVYSLDVKVGDDVSAGQTVATIRNSTTMEITVPFPADEVTNFSVGQSATVTLDSSFETLNATITKISSVNTVLDGNRIVRDVTLDVSNPGGISTSQVATATVGESTSTSSGTFNYKDESVITAKTSGTVSKLLVSEGDWIEKNGSLVSLTSKSLSNEVQSASESLRNAQLSLENQYDQLDNYTIKSPISGTIIDKSYKAGETTESNKALCTIYDLSYLTMTLNVDELDVSDIAVGQEVNITADSVEDKTFTGVVTKVSVAGTTTNGVTTYPVTIKIEESDGLLPGMNVDTSIVINSSMNTLSIPINALSRGNKVLITSDSPSAKNALDTEAPEGYVYISVKTGISDDDYIEITEGLAEEDTVAYKEMTTASNSEKMNDMPGGMPGGGMPSGGGGGMPSGGMPSGGGRGGF